MTQKIKHIIENYQCPGCIIGHDTECFVPENDSGRGIGCSKHCAGTGIVGHGKLFLGMPKGFNRVGLYEDQRPRIFEKYHNNYDMFNIPVWKYLDDHGNTLVRGIMPRRNEPFLDIYLENCIEEINCLEITSEDISKMD